MVAIGLALTTARTALAADAHAAAPPPLLDAFNRHPLTVFLVANLLTGAVNLSMDTAAASHATAAAVLTLYMALVCATAILAGRYWSPERQV